METTRIEDFQVGKITEGYFMIKSSVVKITNTNSKYMDLILSDKTGEVNGKWWGYKEEEGENFIAGTLIKTRGMVTDWRGKIQYRVDRIRCIEDQDGVNPEDFVLAAPMDPEDMLENIIEYVIDMENRDIKDIVTCALEEKREKLMHYPAAMKNHHSIRSGLLYHILTMLRMAEKTCQVYLNLDKDLLYGGVILHDLEKINEMDSNELGIVSGYTMEGTLLGHIVQGIKSIERIGKQVDADPELVILLQHMLLSHHYEPEFGSPKRPMIPEAEILHYLDVIDARMYDMQKELDGIDEGEFSERVWVLHNRQIYKQMTDKDDLREKDQDYEE